MSAKNVKTYQVELTNKPGSLASLTANLREANVDMMGGWAWVQQENQTSVMLIGHDPARTEEALKKSGVNYTTGEACLWEGDDKLGTFHDILQQAAQANVNLHAANAISTNGKFCAILWADEGQHKNLCHALGC